MQWVSRIHETLGIEWKEEGWFFNNPTEDYNTYLCCKECGRMAQINECKKDEMRGYSGDLCCAPVFYLCCPTCYRFLAVINEGSGEYRPLLNLEKNGEFVSS